VYFKMLIALGAVISVPAFAQDSEFSRHSQLPECPPGLGTRHQQPCRYLNPPTRDNTQATRPKGVPRLKEEPRVSGPYHQRGEVVPPGPVPKKPESKQSSLFCPKGWQPAWDGNDVNNLLMIVKTGGVDRRDARLTSANAARGVVRVCSQAVRVRHNGHRNIWSCKKGNDPDTDRPIPPATDIDPQGTMGDDRLPMMTIIKVRT
jgi:hypothetical protein